MLCPARLSVAKGLLEFIELFKESPKTQMFTILVPGNGELEEQIIAKITATGIDMRLLGYKKQNEMVELYAIADVFLMPSLSDPNPLTCVEALWSGLPLIVSTHVGNYPEVIKQGVNGYVFDYDKKDESIRIFDKLAEQSEQWYDMAKAVSRKIAEENYDPDKILTPTIQYLINKHSQKNV